MAAVEPGVEPARPAADFDDKLLRQARRLLGDRVANLGAGGELSDRTLHLVALDDSVDELACARARQRLLDQAVERAGSRELGGYPLRHVMLDQRLHEVLRQRLCERPVDQSRELGDEVLPGRGLDRAARGPRRHPCREEGEPSGRAEARAPGSRPVAQCAAAAAETPRRSNRWSPTRSELAIAVSAGLTAPMLGKTLVSTT